MMIDLLFVELGAVVTEVAGPTRCTVEIFCDPRVTPTYGTDRRVAIDFELLLEHVIEGQSWMMLGVAVSRAHYDRIIGHPSPAIGPSWPGGVYEGIVTIRHDLVRADPVLTEAYASAPAQPWEYHVVASIDASGTIRRYHGFHADLYKVSGDALELDVADAGKSHETSKRTRVLYDPTDTKTFFSGSIVDDYVVSRTRPSGAVYVAPEAAMAMGMGLPKLPPGAGL